MIQATSAIRCTPQRDERGLQHLRGEHGDRPGAQQAGGGVREVERRAEERPRRPRRSAAVSTCAGHPDGGDREQRDAKPGAQVREVGAFGAGGQGRQQERLHRPEQEHRDAGQHEQRNVARRELRGGRQPRRQHQRCGVGDDVGQPRGRRSTGGGGAPHRLGTSTGGPRVDEGSPAGKAQHRGHAGAEGERPAVGERVRRTGQRPAPTHGTRRASALQPEAGRVPAEPAARPRTGRAEGRPPPPRQAATTAAASRPHESARTRGTSSGAAARSAMCDEPGEPRTDEQSGPPRQALCRDHRRGGCSPRGWSPAPAAVKTPGLVIATSR